MRPEGVSVPDWLFALLGATPAGEGEAIRVRDQRLVVRGGVLRLESLVSGGQAQTSSAFGFKWKNRDTFESAASLARARAWLVQRYGDVEKADWWDEYPDDPVVLDAGCGAAMSALELFGTRLGSVRYLGVDISEAVDVAAARMGPDSPAAGYLQADLMALPLPPASVHVVFSEGVLHHTDSTEAALHSLAGLLVPGGRFLFYVYRRKGPVREFTDDYIRGRLQAMPPDQAWAAMMPLTKLGKVLGDLDVEVDVPEDVEILGIPAGRISVQRLLYWHVFKAFHHPELTLEELNHINFDWYAPRNAHRQTPEEVEAWCDAAGLDVERRAVEEAGITITARKRPG